MTGIDALTLAGFEHVLMDQPLPAPCLHHGAAATDDLGLGTVVNIGSIMGERGEPDAISYPTAKGGVANFTRALAADLGKRGINVNAIARASLTPGWCSCPTAGPRTRDRLVQGHT